MFFESIEIESLDVECFARSRLRNSRFTILLRRNCIANLAAFIRIRILRTSRTDSRQQNCRQQASTDENMKNRAYQLIYNRRFAEEVQIWLDELRDEAYINLMDSGSAQ